MYSASLSICCMHLQIKGSCSTLSLSPSARQDAHFSASCVLHASACRSLYIHSPLTYAVVTAGHVEPDLLDLMDSVA